jgi:dephospho-CoA kinase
MIRKVVVLAGLARSGKDTIADYLCKSYGFTKFVMSSAIEDEMKGRGLETDKKSTSEFGDTLRKEHGMDAVAKLIIKKVEKSPQAKDIVIVGPRSPEEIRLFRRYFPELLIVKVEGSREARYTRRSEKDPQDKEGFFGRDLRDVENKGLQKVLDMADVVIDNNAGPEEAYRQADSIIKRKVRG